MSLLFPADSLERYQPERDYRGEVEAARQNGYGIFIFDFDTLTRGDAHTAVRFLPVNQDETILLYRGWMLRQEFYGPLYEALLSRGYRLLTNPDAYHRTHDFSQSAAILEQYGPASLIFPGNSATFDDKRLELIATQLAQKWPDSSLVVKDFVKSQKFAWNEACFIPSSRDHEATLKVIRRFLELQGELL